MWSLIFIVDVFLRCLLWRSLTGALKDLRQSMEACQKSDSLWFVILITLFLVCMSAVCRSVGITVCRSVYLVVCLSSYLMASLVGWLVSISLSATGNQPGCISVCLSFCIYVCLSLWLPGCLSGWLPIFFSLLVCLSLCLSGWLAVCLYNRPSGWLSVCLVND